MSPCSFTGKNEMCVSSVNLPTKSIWSYTFILLWLAEHGVLVPPGAEVELFCVRSAEGRWLKGSYDDILNPNKRILLFHYRASGRKSLPER